MNLFGIKRLGRGILISLVSIYTLLYVSYVYAFPYDSYSLRMAIVISLVLIFITSLVKVLLKGKITRIYLIVLLYAVYIFIMTILFKGLDFSSLLNALFFPIVFLAGYGVLSQNNKTISFNIEYYFSLLLVIFSILLFYKLVVQLQFQGMIINSIYYQILLIPFVLMLDSKKLKYFLIFLILLGVFLTMKRLPLIVLLLSIMVYYLSSSSHSGRRLSFKFLGFVFLLGSIVFILDGFVLNIDGYSLMQRMSGLLDDGGSGRLEIIQILVNHYPSIEFYRMMTGHGIFTASELTGIAGSHNDFLDMLWSFGVIGLLLYLALYIELIKYAFIFKRSKYRYYPAFLASLIIFFLVSLFSQLIFIPTYISFLAVFWAYTISNYHFYQQQIKLT